MMGLEKQALDDPENDNIGAMRYFGSGQKTSSFCSRGGRDLGAANLCPTLALFF